MPPLGLANINSKHFLRHDGQCVCPPCEGNSACSNHYENGTTRVPAVVLSAKIVHLLGPVRVEEGGGGGQS